MSFGPVADVLLLSGVGAHGRHLMGSDEEQVGQSSSAWSPCGAAEHFAAWPGPSSRRRDLAPGGWYPGPPELVEVSLLQPAAIAALPGSKVVPSASMRCRITASLRAKATFALRIPARFASRIAQLLRAEPLTGRVMMTLAAS